MSAQTSPLTASSNKSHCPPCRKRSQLFECSARFPVRIVQINLLLRRAPEHALTTSLAVIFSFACLRVRLLPTDPVWKREIRNPSAHHQKRPVNSTRRMLSLSKPRQLRSVPSSADRLDQKHAGIHAPALNIDVIAFVRKGDRLRRDHLEIVVDPTLIPVGKEL